MKIEVLTAPLYDESIFEEYDLIKVFLAGGITNCWNWQNRLIEIFNQKIESGEYKRTNKLILINPRRENFPINDPSAAEEQIEWEFSHLNRCDMFTMYFAGGVSDQPICMYELGRNLTRIVEAYRDSNWSEIYQHIQITCETGYKRYRDVMIQTQLATRENLSKIVPDVYDDPEVAIMKHADAIYKKYCSISGYSAD